MGYAPDIHTDDPGTTPGWGNPQKKYHQHLKYVPLIK